MHSSACSSPAGTPACAQSLQNTSGMGSGGLHYPQAHAGRSGPPQGTFDPISPGSSVQARALTPQAMHCHRDRSRS